jgi:hypothetical protein
MIERHLSGSSVSVYGTGCGCQVPEISEKHVEPEVIQADPKKTGVTLPFRNSVAFMV